MDALEAPFPVALPRFACILIRAYAGSPYEPPAHTQTHVGGSAHMYPRPIRAYVRLHMVAGTYTELYSNERRAALEKDKSGCHPTMDLIQGFPVTWCAFST